MTLQQDIAKTEPNALRIYSDAQSAIIHMQGCQDRGEYPTDEDLEKVQTAMTLLSTYMRIGSTGDVLKAFKAAMILDEYTTSQPLAIREAWDAYLKQQGAR